MHYLIKRGVSFPHSRIRNPSKSNKQPAYKCHCPVIASPARFLSWFEKQEQVNYSFYPHFPFYAYFDTTYIVSSVRILLILVSPSALFFRISSREGLSFEKVCFIFLLSTCSASISCPKASGWLRSYFVVLLFQSPDSILFEVSGCRL